MALAARRAPTFSSSVHFKPSRIGEQLTNSIAVPMEQLLVRAPTDFQRLLMVPGSSAENQQQKAPL
eukprot:5027017-Pleurochrysis_carterae.AAC.1